jgi:hypothetical protein
MEQEERSTCMVHQKNTITHEMQKEKKKKKKVPFFLYNLFNSYF